MTQHAVVIAGGGPTGRDAVTLLEQSSMALHAAAARHRLGEHIGGGTEGAELRAATLRYFAEQAIQDPESMLAMLAPEPGPL